MPTYWQLTPVAVLAMAASSAYAVTIGYVNAPPFTPQRTLFWTFGASSRQTPVTAAGPTWDTGDWICDEITCSSNAQWYDTNSN